MTKENALESLLLSHLSFSITICLAETHRDYLTGAKLPMESKQYWIDDLEFLSL